MSIAIITHPQCQRHDMGYQHPEAPARLTVIKNALEQSDFKSALHFYEAPLVTFEQLARVHNPDYLRRLESIAPDAHSEQMHWIGGDTGMMAQTLPAAARAAGAAVLATDLVLSGQHQAAFCLIRPPGHHAGRAYAMGFCFYNNLAVAVSHALTQHQLERVAIVDFDVHHGNGTENIVTGDSRILFCSSFQHPFYPYQGANSTAANVCNLPLPAHTNGTAYQAAVVQAWLPRLEAFKPQMVFFSAGFDGHAADNMSMFQLLDTDYAWLTAQVKIIADKYAAGKIVSCLEGGYNQSVLGGSVVAHIRALL